MKLAISNIAWSNEDNQQIYHLMSQYGFSGLEIAPTQILTSQPYEDLEAAETWSRKLKAEGFVVPSMQSIWYGRQERLFGSEEELQSLMEYTRKAVDFANVIGCKNIVFGCPKNRNFLPDAKRDTGVNFFKKMGEYAYSKGTRIGMEANPTIYQTNYINTTAEAIQLVEEVHSKGFLLNLDIGTMIENRETVDILNGKIPLISHVHISEPYLNPIEEREIHKQLAEILKTEKYNGYASIEMKRIDDSKEIERVLKYIQEVFG